MSARRSTRRPPPRRRSRRVLVVAALVSVGIGAAFAAGALSARTWWRPTGTPVARAAGVRSPGEVRVADAAAQSSSASSWKAWLGLGSRKGAAEAEAAGRGDRAAKAAPPAPVLTFYQELTAPLAPPARPAPAVKAPPAPAVAALPVLPPPIKPPAPLASATTSPVPAQSRGEATTADPGGRRFTIQVGAYRARETADAVRARLVGSGEEVYITESEGPEGARYRVRVGSFESHDAARAAAAKLAAERQVPTYVTTR